jgi:hypothetical protein
MGGPGSGRKKGSGSSKKETVQFSLSTYKMKANPMPKALKAKFKKAGGVNSKAYQSWIKANWAS